MGLARIALWSSILASLFRLVKSELTLSIYGNSAMHGQPEEVRTLDGLQLALPRGRAFSAEVTGQLVYEADAYYAFQCSFAHAQVAFVWVDDHMLCHTQPPFGYTAWASDGTQTNPLMGKKGQAVTVIVHIYNSVVSSGPNLTVATEWAQLDKPASTQASVSWQPVPSHALLPTLPDLELKRRELQQRTKQGWNVWSYNMLQVIKLPESCGFTAGLCQLSSGHCLANTRIEDDKDKVRVGMFATDLSYWQFYLGWKGINVSMSYSGGDHLSFLAEPVSCGKAANCSDYAVVLLPTFSWERAGTISVAGDNSSVTFLPLGQPAVTLRLTHTGSVHDGSFQQLDAGAPGAPALVLPLGDGPIGLQEARATGGAAPTAETTGDTIRAARAKEVSRIATFARDQEGGQRYTTKEALQASTMWNYIYTPAEYGPTLPVSRSWNRVPHAVSNEWGYVIFDWDNIFASFMTSMDPTSKDIAYSNLIQVIRGRTAQGFVPNVAAGGDKSLDRTEPPVGAKVLLEMYRRYSDKWLVEFLFDDLLGWSDWFLRARVLEPLGMIAVGSSFVDGYDKGGSYMQAARWESGLDNSPMYDGDFFNTTSGLMELYDVGMSSMFVQEAASLAELARIIGRPESLASSLEARAKSMREKIAANLWDAEGGIFTNRHPNGSFYRRISPTSFYAMLAGAATDEQAVAMSKNWLMSPEHFCISPEGDFAGNEHACYWGLPSIDFKDPAYMVGWAYWRGYVWGPMALLTYWSLLQYDHLPEVRQGRKALCKQMEALMLSQWRQNRHICENYSPDKTAKDHRGDCSGTKFYHWGALNGMISLIEQGFYSGGPGDTEILI